MESMYCDTYNAVQDVNSWIFTLLLLSNAILHLLRNWNSQSHWRAKFPTSGFDCCYSTQGDCLSNYAQNIFWCNGQNLEKHKRTLLTSNISNAPTSHQ